MKSSRVDGAKPGKGAAPAANKASSKQKPSDDFARQLADAKKPQQASKKPPKQNKAAQKQDGGQPKDRHLTVADIKAQGMRSVTVTGSVSRTNKHGDMVDGGLAHAGRVTKSATVTVSVTEVKKTSAGTYEKRRAEKTYTGDEVRPTTLSLGNGNTIVTVHGEIGTSVALTAGPRGSVVVDAHSAKVTGRDRETDARHQLSFSRQQGGRSSVTVYQGSPSGDHVSVRSKGKVLVEGGAGNDKIFVQGGKISKVDAGAGNDVVGVFGRPSIVDFRTPYHGGDGQNVYAFYDGGDKSQVKDFDPLKDDIPR